MVGGRLIIVITFIITLSLRPAIAGRLLLTGAGATHGSSTSSLPLEVNNNEKRMVRGKMGSRPPRCQGRCRSCGHCEAIQVPTKSNYNAFPNPLHYSDYKPMSWKCKCGTSIFNP